MPRIHTNLKNYFILPSFELNGVLKDELIWVYAIAQHN